MSKNRKFKGPSGSSGDRRREVLGVIGLGGALFLLIATISLQTGQLVMGPFGRSTASAFYGLAGLCGYLVIALAIAAAVRALIEREPVMPVLVAVGAAIAVVSLATLVHLAFAHYRVA